MENSRGSGMQFRIVNRNRIENHALPRRHKKYVPVLKNVQFGQSGDAVGQDLPLFIDCSSDNTHIIDGSAPIAGGLGNININSIMTTTSSTVSSNGLPTTIDSLKNSLGSITILDTTEGSVRDIKDVMPLLLANAGGEATALELNKSLLDSVTTLTIPTGNLPINISGGNAIDASNLPAISLAGSAVYPTLVSGVAVADLSNSVINTISLGDCTSTVSSALGSLDAISSYNIDSSQSFEVVDSNSIPLLSLSENDGSSSIEANALLDMLESGNIPDEPDTKKVSLISNSVEGPSRTLVARTVEKPSLPSQLLQSKPKQSSRKPKFTKGLNPGEIIAAGSAYLSSNSINDCNIPLNYVNTSTSSPRRSNKSSLYAANKPKAAGRKRRNKNTDILTNNQVAWGSHTDAKLNLQNNENNLHKGRISKNQSAHQFQLPDPLQCSKTEFDLTSSNIHSNATSLKKQSKSLNASLPPESIHKIIKKEKTDIFSETDTPAFPFVYSSDVVDEPNTEKLPLLEIKLEKNLNEIICEMDEIDPLADIQNDDICDNNLIPDMQLPDNTIPVPSWEKHDVPTALTDANYIPDDICSATPSMPLDTTESLISQDTKAPNNCQPSSSSFEAQEKDEDSDNTIKVSMSHIAASLAKIMEKLQKCDTVILKKTNDPVSSTSEPSKDGNVVIIANNSASSSQMDILTVQDAKLLSQVFAASSIQKQAEISTLASKLEKCNTSVKKAPTTKTLGIDNISDETTDIASNSDCVSSTDDKKDLKQVVKSSKNINYLNNSKISTNQINKKASPSKNKKNELITQKSITWAPAAKKRSCYRNKFKIRPTIQFPPLTNRLPGPSLQFKKKPIVRLERLALPPHTLHVNINSLLITSKRIAIRTNLQKEFNLPTPSPLIEKENYNNKEKSLSCDKVNTFPSNVHLPDNLSKSTFVNSKSPCNFTREFIKPTVPSENANKIVDPSNDNFEVDQIQCKDSSSVPQTKNRYNKIEDASIKAKTEIEDRTVLEKKKLSPTKETENLKETSNIEFDAEPFSDAHIEIIDEKKDDIIPSEPDLFSGDDNSDTEEYISTNIDELAKSIVCKDETLKNNNNNEPSEFCKSTEAESNTTASDPVTSVSYTGSEFTTTATIMTPACLMAIKQESQGDLLDPIITTNSPPSLNSIEEDNAIPSQSNIFESLLQASPSHRSQSPTVHSSGVMKQLKPTISSSFPLSASYKKSPSSTITDPGNDSSFSSTRLDEPVDDPLGSIKEHSKPLLLPESSCSNTVMPKSKSPKKNSLCYPATSKLSHVATHKFAFNLIRNTSLIPQSLLSSCYPEPRPSLLNTSTATDAAASSPITSSVTSPDLSEQETTTESDRMFSALPTIKKSPEKVCTSSAIASDNLDESADPIINDDNFVDTNIHDEDYDPEYELPEDFNPFDLEFTTLDASKERVDGESLEMVGDPMELKVTLANTLELTSGNINSDDSKESIDYPDDTLKDEEGRDSDSDDALDDPNYDANDKLSCPKCSYKTKNLHRYQIHTASHTRSSKRKRTQTKHFVVESPIKPKARLGRPPKNRFPHNIPSSPQPRDYRLVPRATSEEGSSSLMSLGGVSSSSNSIGQESGRAFDICCNKCLYTTTSYARFRSHMVKHYETNSCPYCSYRTNSEKEMSAHKEIHAMQRKYYCSHCTFTTLNQRTFVVHKAAHKMYRKGSDNRGKKVRRSSKKALPRLVKLKCPTCNYMTLSSLAYKSHLQTHHTTRKRECPYCSFSTTDEELINSHIAQHRTAVAIQDCH